MYNRTPEELLTDILSNPNPMKTLREKPAQELLDLQEEISHKITLIDKAREEGEKYETRHYLYECFTGLRQDIEDNLNFKEMPNEK